MAAGTCRVCGCTDWQACPRGCWWVEDDLCSACAPKKGKTRLRADAVTPDAKAKPRV